MKPDQSPIDRVRVLLSFHAFRRLDMEAFAASCVFDGKQPDIFADSGAFSAWTQGAAISVDDYAEWVHRWKSVLGVFCNLDVIDDPAATDVNQRALESLGLRPLPVWHIRSDQRYFRELCEEYRYIAIGGMVGTRWERLMPKLVWAIRHARSTDTVLHALGLTSLEPLRQLPFFSADSSAWCSGFKFGTLRIWDRRQHKFHQGQLGDAKQWASLANATRALGFDPTRFANREAIREEVAAISGLSVAFQEAAVRRRVGTVALPPGDKPYTNFGRDEGTNLFLAGGDPAAMAGVSSGLKLFLADSIGLDVQHVRDHLVKEFA